MRCGAHLDHTLCHHEQELTCTQEQLEMVSAVYSDIVTPINYYPSSYLYLNPSPLPPSLSQLQFDYDEMHVVREEEKDLLMKVSSSCTTFHN